jgi:hypothetical protein
MALTRYYERCGTKVPRQPGELSEASSVMGSLLRYVGAKQRFCRLDAAADPAPFGEYQS